MKQKKYRNKQVQTAGVGMDTLSGALSGALLSALVLPPFGLIVGGLLGGISSFFVSGSLEKAKRAAERQERIRVTNLNNYNALQSKGQLDSMNYYAKNLGADIWTLSKGISTDKLVYAQKGEVLRKGDSIFEIKLGSKPGVDDVLMSLADGISILGNVKSPLTGNLFKDDGKMIIKKYGKPTDRKDNLARRTLELNKKNQLAEFDNAVFLQELVKQSKGIKQGTKNLVNTLNTGLTYNQQNNEKISSDVYLNDIRDFYMQQLGLPEFGYDFPTWFRTLSPSQQSLVRSKNLDDLSPDLLKLLKGDGDAQRNIMASNNATKVNALQAKALEDVEDENNHNTASYFEEYRNLTKLQQERVRNNPLEMTEIVNRIRADRALEDKDYEFHKPLDPFNGALQGTYKVTAADGSTENLDANAYTKLMSSPDDLLMMNGTYMPLVKSLAQPALGLAGTTAGLTAPSGLGSLFSKSNLGSTLSSGLGLISSLMPTIANMAEGSKLPEQEEFVGNPLQSAYVTALSRMRVDPTQALQAQRDQNATLNYNMQQMGSGRGQYALYRLATNLSLQRNLADTYMKFGQENNRLQANLASLMNEAGIYNAAEQRRVNDVNADNRQNRQNQKNLLYQQLGQFGQMMLQRNAQREQNDLLNKIYQRSLSRLTTV